MTAWAWALVALGVVLALLLVLSVLLWLRLRWRVYPRPASRPADRVRALVVCGLCRGTGQLRRGAVSCPACDGDGKRLQVVK